THVDVGIVRRRAGFVCARDGHRGAVPRRRAIPGQPGVPYGAEPRAGRSGDVRDVAFGEIFRRSHRRHPRQPVRRWRMGGLAGRGHGRHDRPRPADRNPFDRRALPAASGSTGPVAAERDVRNVERWHDLDAAADGPDYGRSRRHAHVDPRRCLHGAAARHRALPSRGGGALRAAGQWHRYLDLLGRDHREMSVVRARRWVFALAGLVVLPSVANALTTQSLDAGWQFRIAPGDAHAAAHPRATHWLPATVPGLVQTDLMASRLIPDPYWRDDEANVQWVGLSDWQYRKTFEVDAATLDRAHVDLVFDGLDTFADVYLNGQKILAADNMFRRWRVPVKALLHAGANTLEVKLYSPIERLQPWLLKQPYALPGEFDSAFGDEPKGKQTSNYVRKAAYQYGWDWGPRVVSEGIWQDVKLESWDALRLADFHIAQRSVT